jgi:hypothetical protein
MPSVVGTSTSQWNATRYPFQRKAFYAVGRFWVFYSDGSNIVYRTSTDGTNWGNAVTVRSVGSGYCSVWFDGVYVHYAFADGSALYYRRGTVNSDGTITWSAAEQAVSTTYGNPSYPFVSVDSNGYAWVSYRESVPPTPTPHVFVIKSGNNDGTWGTTPAGFPYQLSATQWAGMASIIALTNGKMLAVYGLGAATLRAKRWDGSAWGSEKTSASSLSSPYHSALAEGDDVHVAFLKASTYDILHVKYVYANDAFGSETTVRSAATSTSNPILSRRSDNNDLYCFWAGSPIADHVYYKKRADSTWDANPTDWIDENTDDLTGNDRLTGFVNDYNGYIGLVYMTKTASPYDVKFAFLTVVIIKSWTATLNAAHALSRPCRSIGYQQTLQTSHALSRPYRAIKFQAPLNLVGLLVVTKPAGAHATQIFLTLGRSISIKLCG